MQKDNTPVNFSEDADAIQWAGALSGCLAILPGALFILFMIGAASWLAWEDGVKPIWAEITQVEVVHDDPREGEVRVNRRTIKECDGTTLIYTIGTSLVTSDVKIDPNSPECQADPP